MAMLSYPHCTIVRNLHIELVATVHMAKVGDNVVVERVRNMVDKVLNGSFASHNSLCAKAKNSKHCKAAVSEFLGSHHLGLLASFGHASKVEDGAACTLQPS